MGDVGHGRGVVTFLCTHIHARHCISWLCCFSITFRDVPMLNSLCYGFDVKSFICFLSIFILYKLALYCIFRGDSTHFNLEFSIILLSFNCFGSNYLSYHSRSILLRCVSHSCIVCALVVFFILRC